MAMNKEKASGIIVLVIICCVFMALIETIIEPAYIVKSALKVAVFLLLPLVYAKITHTKLLDEFFKIDKRGMMKLFVLGSFIYAVILGAYTLTKNFFDYASLVQSLSAAALLGWLSIFPFAIPFWRNFSFVSLHLSDYPNTQPEK